MWNSVILSAALALGQTSAHEPPVRAHLLPPAVGQAPVVQMNRGTTYLHSPVTQVNHSNSACTPCRDALPDCDVVWLKPWKCEDLEMKPFEPRASCGLFRCAPVPETNGDAKNGNGTNGDAKNGDAKNGNGKNGEAKNGKNGDEKKNGDAKNGDAKNGEEEKKEEEEAPDLTPLMQSIKCRFPMLFDRLECNNTKIYGWIQGGYTGNFDSPRDRLNYGVNFNNRSNDVLLNQLYLVVERPLDLDKKKDCWHFGYRLDTFYGHDAPYWENLNGVLPNFLGDRLEVSRLSEMGLSIPQAYVDLHAPVLTDRGVDFRVGRFYTLMGYELNPAPQTYFYSHNYEFFYGMPFTHTGALATIHLGDTVDFSHGIVRGWDVALSDTNDTWAYTGAWVWNACDKRQNLAIAWVTGPEQIGNNRDDRTAVSAYYTRKWGCYNEWQFTTGGHVAWEQNATADAASAARTAEWYGTTSYLFYTVNPKLTLGTRFEWWRDDDGARTAFANSDFGGARWNRPAYAGNFFDLTFGVTYKPFQNLRVRPEIRFDWFDGVAVDGSGSQPFNDQRDSFQTTLGIDLIWEF